MPATYYLVYEKYESGSIDSKAKANASLVAELMRHYPDSLVPGNDRLSHFVQEDSPESPIEPREVRRIVGSDNAVMHEAPQSAALKWPTLVSRAPIMVEERQSAYFEIERSMSGHIKTAAGLFVILAAVSLMICLLLQRLVFNRLGLTERHMSRKAKFDDLTGLPNRWSAFEELQNRLVKRDKQHIAVLFIDLDRFKAINDNFGHAVGDVALRIATREIKKCLRQTDYFARLAGDEFLVLIDTDGSAAAIKRISECIIGVLAYPHVCLDQELVIGATIGVAIAPEHGNSADLLIQNADMAMYAAKSTGRGRWKIYEEDMSVQLEREMRLRKSLKQALEKSEFQLHYQPLISLGTGETIGAEALLRWRDGRSGMLYSPQEFIPELEASGMIVPVGEWVLRMACRQLRSWRDLPKGFYISVNVSIRQLTENGFVQVVRDILTSEGVMPDSIMLELTESMLLDDRLVREKLKELKDFGLRMAIDDFGTGFSSLSRLSTLPFDVIKIDAEFVRNMNLGNKERSIILSILTLAQGLGMSVIAEGVEQADQRQALLAANCPFGQGYLFALPMPPAVFRKLHLQGLVANTG